MTELIDYKVLRELIVDDIESDRDFFDSLFGRFRDSLNELTDLSIDHIRSNMEAVGQLAHKHKSSSASFGAKKLAEILRKVEQTAKEDRVAETIALFNQVIEIKENTLNELEKSAEIYFARSE